MGETVARGIKSCLFAWKNGDKDGKLNEAMVQNIVCNILDDAVKTYNELSKQVWEEKKKSSEECHDLLPEFQFQLASQPESSMFQKKLDHFVVFETRSCAPLVTVKVKKPVSDLLEHEEVHGQGFDYLMATKMSGNLCPMHITTTVEDESYIAWLPENDETVKEFNQKCKENVRDVLSKIVDKTGRQIGLHELKQSPALKEAEEPCEESKANVSDNDFDEQDVIRKIFTSSAFKAHDLFIMMVNTILCSMCIYCSSFRNCVPRLDAGDRFFQTALKSTERARLSHTSGCKFAAL